MKVVYVAHPLNAPMAEEREANRRSAARWAAWLAKTFNVAVVCDWIVLSSVWSEEEGRALGLEIDKALIARCDGVFLCGPKISPGMRVEADHAMTFAKGVFTCLHESPEAALDDESADYTWLIQKWVDLLVEAVIVQTDATPGREFRPCASCVAGGDDTPQSCEFHEDTGLEPAWLCDDCYRDSKSQPEPREY